jgi:hypothetical protein
MLKIYKIIIIIIIIIIMYITVTNTNTAVLVKSEFPSRISVLDHNTNIFC